MLKPTVKKQTKDNIQVAIRIRPPLEHELEAGNTFQKLVIDKQTKIVNAYNDRTKSYKNSKFDIVFDQQATQGQIFQDCGISDLVQQVVDGFNSTIFAYGQTGSGKTFSMEGYKYQPNDKGILSAVVESGDNEGIVPRSIKHVFDLINSESALGQKKFTVSCSYFQVYKEKIYDLLNKAHLKRIVTDGPGLKLKLVKDIFTVENLYTFECRNAEDVLALYHFGLKNKVVASHNMNSASSRSHSMLKLSVECVDSRHPDNIVVSTLQLVDLAGSERQSLTGNVTSKESIDINKSLLTLRQVITALTEQGDNYVPYRDSKLTCLLRQSLGGNSFCLMLACLNPCDQHIEENLSTLAYAAKASVIVNKPSKNEDHKTKQIEDLKMQVRILNEELRKANETIAFLTALTGQSPNLNFNGVMSQGNRTSQKQDPASLKRQDSELTLKNSLTPFVQDAQISSKQVILSETDEVEKVSFNGSQRIQLQNKYVSSFNHAANESKDAITSRIIHTVNMMREVLQGNLGLRETIQKQSELIDEQNGEIFQLQNENEDLRDRLQVLEDFTGKDSKETVQKLARDKKLLEKRINLLESTTKVLGNNLPIDVKAAQMTNFAQFRIIEQRQVPVKAERGDDEPVRPTNLNQQEARPISSQTKSVDRYSRNNLSETFSEEQFQSPATSNSMLKRNKNFSNIDLKTPILNQGTNAYSPEIIGQHLNTSSQIYQVPQKANIQQKNRANDQMPTTDFNIKKQNIIQGNTSFAQNLATHLRTSQKWSQALTQPVAISLKKDQIKLNTSPKNRSDQKQRLIPIAPEAKPSVYASQIMQPFQVKSEQQVRRSMQPQKGVLPSI